MEKTVAIKMNSMFSEDERATFLRIEQLKNKSTPGLDGFSKSLKRELAIPEQDGIQTICGKPVHMFDTTRRQ